VGLVTDKLKVHKIIYNWTIYNLRFYYLHLSILASISLMACWYSSSFGTP
jgi:hypothetical protein